MFQIDSGRLFNGFFSLQGHVFLITQAEANHIQHLKNLKKKKKLKGKEKLKGRKEGRKGHVELEESSKKPFVKSPSSPSFFLPFHSSRPAKLKKVVMCFFSSYIFSFLLETLCF